MLSADEERAIDGLAAAGEAGLAVEFLRHLAREGRIEDMAGLIDRYHRGVEVNRMPVRRYLAGRVPPVLASCYFPTLGRPLSVQVGRVAAGTPGWADAIVESAEACDAGRLRREVDALVASARTAPSPSGGKAGP